MLFRSVVTAYLAVDLNLSPVKLVLAAALGAFLGDNFAYLLGRKGGRKLINLYCKASLCPRQCAEDAGRFFKRFGIFSVALARFFVGIRAVASPAAGMTKMRWITFAISDALGSLVWAMVFVIGGRVSGRFAVSQVQRFAALGRYALFGLVVLMGLFMGYKWVMVKRSGLLHAEALQDVRIPPQASSVRSEERRVGKECRL